MDNNTNEIYSKVFNDNIKKIEEKYLEILKCKKEIDVLYLELGLTPPDIRIVKNNEEIHKDVEFDTFK